MRQRRWPIEARKRKLATLVRGPRPGIVINEHYEGNGEIVFQHACALGCEGIVSKRLGSTLAVISLSLTPSVYHARPIAANVAKLPDLQRKL